MKWAAWTLWCAIALPITAQGVISSVRVEAIPVGAPFLVDGRLYRSPQVFFWTAGSRHVLDVPPDPLEFAAETEYEFSGWAEKSATLDMNGRRIEITASPAFTEFRATFLRFHRVMVDFEPGAGTVFIGASTLTGPQALYFVENTEVIMRATPAPGWVFSNWNSTNQPGTEPAVRFRVQYPMRLHPVFARGRRVTITTDPPGREVYVERTRVATPYTTEWGYRGTYALGAPSPQRDASGQMWIFDRWSFGGGQNATYTVENGGDFGLTGYFVRGGTIAFFTQPPGLRLNIDGRDNYLSYEFQWPLGATHSVEAPEEQLDATGRRWVFSHWADGGPRERTYTMTPGDAAQGRVTWVAHYTRMPRLTIESPSEAAIVVDGAPCASGCRIDRPAGSVVRLTAPALVELSPDSRLEFVRWSNGAPREAEIQLEADSAIRAEYRRMHRIATRATPETAASFLTEPGEFVAEGGVASIRIQTKPGYRLRHWDGDAHGSANPVHLRVDSPRFVRAILDPAPYVDPLGVRNAAGDTPDDVVAPGSRVSIYGLNLAPSTVVAESMLSQTLDGVTITAKGRLLPLILVSPELIQCVLPWGMPEGEHELVIERAGFPEVRANAQVVRNAPGLFANMIRGHGNHVMLLATGIGPFSPMPLDGLPVPASFGAVFTDTLEVEVDGVVAPHGEVRLSSDLPGVATIELALPAGAQNIRLLVNGRASNTITLESDESDHVDLDQ
jgi:uncharacterized protein (TIGR03437 family)